MSLRPCRNHVLPSKQARPTHLVLLHGIRQRRSQARGFIEDRHARAAKVRQKARLPLIIRCTQRHDGSRANVLDGALRQRVVLTHGVDLHVEKLHTDGRKRIDRKDVHNAAAHAELSRVLRLTHVFVAECAQTF